MNDLHLDLGHWFQITPELLVGFSISVLTILFVVVMSFFLLKGLNRVFNIIEDKQYLSAIFVRFFHSVVRWIVLVIALLLILQQAGIKLNYLWTIISAFTAMVAIGFVAVWSVLSNFLCTLMLILFHPFRIGDDIEIIDPAMTSGISGCVRNINMMFTSLNSVDTGTGSPMVIHIPNNLFFQKILRKKGGDQTFSLDRQLFEKASLLNTNKMSSEKQP